MSIEICAHYKNIGIISMGPSFPWAAPHAEMKHGIN